MCANKDCGRIGILRKNAIQKKGRRGRIWLEWETTRRVSPITGVLVSTESSCLPFIHLLSPLVSLSLSLTLSYQVMNEINCLAVCHSVVIYSHRSLPFSHFIIIILNVIIYSTHLAFPISLTIVAKPESYQASILTWTYRIVFRLQN